MWLIGMMGSGKSTIGRLVADQVGTPFYDTDLLIEHRAGLTIDDIWARFGESEFRRLESEEFQSLPPGSRIIAAGGGAVMDPANRDIITLDDKVVWLRANAATLARRLAGDGTRPLLGESPEGTIVSLLAHRAPVYAELATNQVDTVDKTVDEVVEDVVGIWLT